MDIDAFIPLIWWGLVVALVVVAVWFFWSLVRQRQGTSAHFKAQLEVIEYFSQSVFRQNTTEDILWDIAASCIDKMGLEDCVIYLRDDVKGVWVQKAAYGPKNLDYRAIHEPLELALGQGIVGRVGQTGIAEIVSNTAEDADYVVDDAVRASEMAVPILCDGNVIGVIDSEHTLEGFFQPYHLRLLQSVANICGQKIGRSVGEERIQEFAKFFELNPNPVARLAPSGEVLLSNAAANAVLFDTSSAGPTMPSGSPLRSLLQTACADRKPLQDQVQVGDRWFQVAMAAVSDKPFVHMYAVDVTEAELARDRAAQAERHKSDFLSVMSHEIRTPLNAILGLIELMMRDETLQENQMSHLSYMEFAGKHLQGLLTDVLDLERLDTGKAEPAMTPFVPHELFKRVVNGFQNRAEATGNDLRLDLDDALPRGLVADVGWLTQILNNLLANAIKFTSDGTIECRVEWQEGHVVLEVKDTGKGIAAEDLERIMEPFEQANREQVLNAAQQGVGLGLAITQKLIGLHGGKLEVASVLNEGTTFRCTLPMALADEVENPGQDHHELVERPEIPDLPVLIVDDNELNVLVAQRMVENWGYDVLTASSAAEADALMAATLPFLVLLDVHMPECDGLQAARLWKAGVCRTIPIVGLTADAESHTRQEALEAGMADVVVKPFNPPHLRSVIERFVPREAT